MLRFSAEKKSLLCFFCFHAVCSVFSAAEAVMHFCRSHCLKAQTCRLKITIHERIMHSGYNPVYAYPEQHEQDAFYGKRVPVFFP